MAQGVSGAPGQFVLEYGIPVKLRFSQTVSSADAHVDDQVEFEVLEEIRVSDVMVIPKGGIAWGTGTEAQPKRRMPRSGIPTATLPVDRAQFTAVQFGIWAGK